MPAAHANLAQFVPAAAPRNRPKTEPNRALGLKNADVPAMLKLIDKGLPWSTISSFAKTSGFTPQEIAAFLGIPGRTFARRRASGTLDSVESERLVRLAEVFSSSLDLFNGDVDATRQWLTSPVRGLGNARPVDYAMTDLGGREVRNLIGRLMEGVFS